MNNIFVGIILICIFSFTAEAKKTINISSDLEISDREKISLFDLVNSSDILDSAEVEKLNSFQFPIASGYTNTDILHEIKKSDEFVSWLNEKEIRLNLPKQIKLEITTGKISEVEVKKKLHAQLKSFCRNCDFIIKIKNLPKLKSNQWNFDFSNLQVRKSILLPIVYNVETQNQIIPIELKIFTQGLVLNKFIAQNQKINQEDVELKTVELTQINDVGVPTEQLGEIFAIRALPMNTILNQAMIRKSFVINRGQQVKAIIGKNDFEISIDATSESNGFIGDIVRVKSLLNQKILNARVVAKDLVEIE